MTRFLAHLLLVATIALALALGLRTYTESEPRGIRQQLAEDEVLRLVHLVTAEQQRIAEGAEQVLDTIASIPAVQDNQAEVCQRLIANLLKRSPRYNSAAILGLDGHNFCAPDQQAATLDVSDRTDFRLALQTGGFVIGEYLVGRGSEKPGVPMAKPITNQNGQVVGVVEVGLDVHWLGRQLARLALPPGAVATIADRNGIILARTPDGAPGVGQPIPAGDRYSLEGHEIRIAPVTGLDGRLHLEGYSPPGADPQGLRVWIGLDRMASFAAATQANRVALMLTIAGAVLAAVIAALLGKRLIRRLHDRLLAGVDRRRTRNIPARAGLSGDPSGFGRRADAFGRTADAHDAQQPALPVSIALLDKAGTIVAVNEAWRRFAAENGALDRDAFIGWNYLAVTRSAASAEGHGYAAEVAAALPRVLAGEQEQFTSYYPCHGPGGEHWFLLIAVPAPLHGGGAVVMNIDVSTVHQTDEHQSEELFRMMFEQAAVGMAQVGLNGAWQRVNDKLCAITGYTRDELLTRTFADITHPDEREADFASGKALLAGEITTFTREKRYLRKDGGVVWVNLAVSLLRDPEDRPEQFMAVIEDITERKRFEVALRESETRLQLAREAAGFGVSDWNLVTGTAVWSDEKWRQLGREPQAGSLDREAWAASLHPEDRERVLGELAASFADPARSYDTEYRVVWPDGTVRWQLVKGKVSRGAGGEAVRLICLSLDVTERRDIEAALRRAQRLEAVGQLTGGLAHDFNNLLGIIVLEAELLADGPEPSTARAASEIVSTAQRGADLVHRLLAFGRRQPLRVQVVDLNALLQQEAALLCRTLPELIQVDLDLAQDLWAVEVDPSELQSALLNLAINARDAMPDGGRLVIATANVVLNAGAAKAAEVAPGDYAGLTVADTGTGMSSRVMEQALEPFFTTKSPGVGTGLGLPMIYGLVRQSGGHLTIESAPGVGTTVRLLLPRACAQAGPSVAMPAPAPVRGRGRVLLVDDNEPLRTVATRQLASLGYEVWPAECGPVALSMLRDGQRFDLLFTDEVMPGGMSGTQLAEAARRIQPELKVLFTSGYHQPAAANTGAEIRHVLAKPYRRADLAAKVQEALAA